MENRLLRAEQSEELPPPPIQFESPPNVTDLQRSMDFIGQTLGLEACEGVLGPARCLLQITKKIHVTSTRK
jgi:hypothetical protein